MNLDIIIGINTIKGTSKNTIRHAELVSASPNNQGIAGQARNDERMIIGIFRSPLKKST